MNYEKLTQICEDINSCFKWQNHYIDCGRDITASPKIVEIRNTQKMLLITRDPSNEANKLNSVTDFENSFFSNKILHMLFEEYDVNSAKSDENYFKRFREKFIELIYWTHYQKCFPGKNNKGDHKQPKKHCARKYLNKEIIAAEPEYIVAMGSKAVEFVTGKKLLDAIPMNGNNSILVNGIRVPVIAITHLSDRNVYKHDPEYKFKKTVQLIREIVSCY